MYFSKTIQLYEKSSQRVPSKNELLHFICIKYRNKTHCVLYYSGIHITAVINIITPSQTPQCGSFSVKQTSQHNSSSGWIRSACQELCAHIASTIQSFIQALGRPEGEGEVQVRYPDIFSHEDICHRWHCLTFQLFLFSTDRLSFFLSLYPAFL